MATQYEEKKETFLLQSDESKITIKVKIGNGQGGGFFIFREFERIAVNKSVTIEKGSDCIDQTFTIVAVIKDKLLETNRTSVLVTFKEDNNKSILFGPYTKEVINDFDTIIYTIKIKVKK